jgi:hypothetical protein
MPLARACRHRLDGRIVPIRLIGRTISPEPSARDARSTWRLSEPEETTMTDDATKTTGPEMGARDDDSFAWTEPEGRTGDAGAKAREWIGQLQSMIEQLATQAGPVVKEVGAKAAELAALAGEKAGPVAEKAAEVTGKAGEKLAVKGRDLAAELRRDTSSKSTDETVADIAEAVGTESSTADDRTTTGVA